MPRSAVDDLQKLICQVAEIVFHSGFFGIAAQFVVLLALHSGDLRHGLRDVLCCGIVHA